MLYCLTSLKVSCVFNFFCFILVFEDVMRAKDYVHAGVIHRDIMNNLPGSYLDIFVTSVVFCIRDVFGV